MFKTKKWLEQCIVLLFSVIIIAGYCVYGGFFTPLLAALLIAAILRTRLFIKLRPIDDKYCTTGRHDPNDKHTVTVSIWNLLRVRPTVTLAQNSDKYGDWISNVLPSDLLPTYAIGMFEYTSSGHHQGEKRGGQKGDWGQHQVYFNPEKGVIHIQATAKELEGENQFVWKRMER